MTPKVLFGLMSSQQGAGTVGQLVDALQGRPVVIHHDFTKQQDFALPLPNVRFVPAPKVTGWGTWGFAQAVLHTIRHALEHHDFDYFQLLSPTCLPIRPIEAFEAFLGTDTAEIHADMMDVEADDDTLMHFGYRTFCAGQSLRFKVLRRVRAWYFGSDSRFIQIKSLSMFRRPADVAPTPSGRLALALTRLAAAGHLGSHPFGPEFRPMIGSTWFGARRRVCEYIVRRGQHPEIERYFSHVHLVDESVLPALLGNSGFRIGRSNHVISPFDLHGHPRWIEEADLGRMRATGRFFARKFPDDPAASVRRNALMLANPEVTAL
jgi:hypothetical protein